MLDVFYPKNHDFLVRRHGTNPTHYWANWDLCNVASVMAIGVLCDRRDLYDEAITYFKSGVGNGSIEHVVYYMHSGNLGQWQESGRDQGHERVDEPHHGRSAHARGPTCPERTRRRSRRWRSRAS